MATKRKTSPRQPPKPRTHAKRRAKVTQVAYWLAARACFGGEPVRSWLKAEREIDAEWTRLAS